LRTPADKKKYQTPDKARQLPEGIQLLYTLIIHRISLRRPNFGMDLVVAFFVGCSNDMTNRELFAIIFDFD